MFFVRPRVFLLVLSAASMLLAGPLARAGSASVYLEELTWTEVRDDLQAGKSTVIIPVGGTEQSGPHMVLGKHNVRVRLLAGRIAAQLGNTLVAPVLAYVPEGAVTPPAGHMRYAGTISVPDDAFQSILAGSARSLKQHGFVNVVLLGDHGGYQSQLQAVAQRLNREWASSGARVHYISAYYEAADTGYVQALRAKGYSAAQIGVHAGLADTSLSLALDAALVRPDALPRAAQGGRALGVNGDPAAASAALGQPGVELMISKTVAAIRAAQGQRR
ncbi:MAG: creatininase family protein [Sphingomonadaceae bacterium]